MPRGSMSIAPPEKTVVVDALVLAFSNSALAEVVGTDALRMVLDLQFKDLMKGNHFYLENLWPLLEEQPGFDPDMAVAPLCRFKCWEAELGIEVHLPEHLGNPDKSRCAQLAASCPVPKVDLLAAIDEAKGRVVTGQVEIPSGERRLNTTVSPDPAMVERQKRAKAAKAAKNIVALPQATLETPMAKAPRLSGKKRALLAIASLVFVLTGTRTALSLTAHFASANWSPIEEFRVAVPAVDGYRHGNEVGATLSDQSWLSIPPEQRVDNMRRALEEVEASVFFVKDKKGRLRAAARYYFDEDGEQRVRVSFY